MSRAITDTDFNQEVLQSPGLVMVDFWAEWCGPCKALGPVIDTIAKEHANSLKVFKLDVDANPSTPTQYNIRGIPTVLFFKEGKLVDQLVGNQPHAIISQTIAKHQGT